MTDPTLFDSLRSASDRLVRDEPVTLTPEEQIDLLRLVHELETARVDLETQNEQLRRVSRELEVSRDEYHDLFETAPVAFVTLSDKGIVERVNDRAQKLLSTVHNQIVGHGFSTFVDPDDWGVYYGSLKKIAHAKAPVLFEIRLAGDHRQTVYLHVEAAPKLGPGSRFSHWRLALFDVSEARRRQMLLEEVYEQLEMASRAAALGVWNYDLNRGTATWNANLYRLLGLKPRQGHEDVNLFFDFIHPEDRKGNLADIEAVLAMHDSEVKGEFRVIRADGQTRWMAARGRIYRDGTGRPQRMSGVNYDITDRKRVEENVRLTQLQMTAQLAKTKRINEELSQYAYAVSHDLKEPMRAVRNYADFLYDDLAGTLGPEQKKYLQGLKAAVDLGDALIDDLLTFSRIGQTSPNKTRLRLADLIDEIASLLERPAEVQVTVQPDCPPLTTDRTLLKQILQNLITNGIKFNRRSPKRIRIGWQTIPPNKVEIFVRDNGIGIAKQYHAQVFRIFQRLHTAKEFPGTGIGLAIVNKAAGKLDGSVRLESDPGKGSTFYVRLPLENVKTDLETNGFRHP